MGIAHGRCELLWLIAGGAERASCSFSTASLLAASHSDLQLMADTVQVLFGANVWNAGGIQPDWPVAVSFIGARVSSIRADGTTADSAESIIASPTTGAPDEPALPPEVAIVVSLRTSTPGARGRGRMYMPGPKTSKCTANGNVDPTTLDTLLFAMQAYFNDLNANVDFIGTVSVASNAGGFVTAVDTIKVGNVFDVQRSRRDALVESYMAATITP